jgi:DNA (cytosine-5)-methyltransferase 1
MLYIISTNKLYSCGICISTLDQISHHKSHINTQQHKDKKELFELKLSKLKEDELFQLHHSTDIKYIVVSTETIIQELFKKIEKKNISKNNISIYNTTMKTNKQKIISLRDLNSYEKEEIDKNVKSVKKVIMDKKNVKLKKNAISSDDSSSDDSGSDNENNDNSNLTFIDLFCGIGGFHQAMKTFNYECVFASDIDENCRDTYFKNYGIKPHGDITKVKISDIPKFDILCGGFPCQPFSKAGNQIGFDDKRGNLFFDICRIAKYHKPKYMILENVRNLASHDDGNTWNVIKENINKLGYYTYDTPLILNVLHFNIPQNRERVIILCKRKDLGNLKKLPKIFKNPKKNLTTNISDYIVNDINYNKKFKLNAKMEKTKNIWDKFIKILINNNITIPKYPIWTEWWDNEINSDKNFYKKYTTWIDKNRIFYNENIQILKKWLDESREEELWTGAVRKFEWQAGDLQDNDDMNKIIWTARGSGIRVKRTNYIPTLVAMSMIPVYGPENRKLSPKELLKLQSFPVNFIHDEKKIYKQIGNAVNVKMIKQCTKFLIFNKKLF